MNGFTAMQALFYGAVFLLGTVMASFFMCIGTRSAEGKSWIKGRSACEKCGHALGIADLIPLLSYWLLRGKCRYCGARIPFLYPAGELLLGIYYVLCFKTFGMTAELLKYMLLSGLLLGLSAADLNAYVIPDGFIITGVLLWISSILLEGGLEMQNLKNGLTGAFLIGGGILAISMIFDHFYGTESLGGGDVKLYFMTGLFLGPFYGLAQVLLSCIFGLFFSLIMKKQKIPFGPSISIAACLILLWK